MRFSVSLFLLTLFISFTSSNPTKFNKKITQFPPIKTHTQGNRKSQQPADEIHTPEYKHFPSQFVQDQLKDITKSLKTFLSWEKFDTVEFQVLEGYFAERIRCTRHIMLKYTSHNEEVTKQLEYTQKVFRMMVDSVGLMTFYHNEDNLPHILIHKTIQLNVQLLMLHDSYGRPDLSFPRYNHIVTQVKHALEYWGDIFNSTPTNASSLSLVFGSEYTRAHNTLVELEHYFVKGPGHEKEGV